MVGSVPIAEIDFKALKSVDAAALSKSQNS